MNQIIRELKRQFAGEKLEPEQLKGLIRAGYIYRNGDEHLLTEKAVARSLSSGCTPARQMTQTTPHRNPSISPARPI
jgi:hypothetical protein